MATPPANPDSPPTSLWAPSVAVEVLPVVVPVALVPLVALVALVALVPVVLLLVLVLDPLLEPLCS